MQPKLERGKAAFHIRSISLSVAILAGAPLVAAVSLFAPDQALAACGGAASHLGDHAGGGGGSVHTTTSIAAPSGGGGGGGGGGGCPTGVNPTALRGLPTAASGRVLETGAHAARTESHVRNATTRTTGATAHLHTVAPRHRA